MFKSRIKKLMEQEGFSIRTLAAYADLSTRTVEKARTDDGIAECRLSTLRRIATALDVEVKELFEEA